MTSDASYTVYRSDDLNQPNRKLWRCNGEDRGVCAQCDQHLPILHMHIWRGANDADPVAACSESCAGQLVTPESPA